jgi:FKBP-type peptidyl-prolyl cis-trans isomerase
MRKTTTLSLAVLGLAVAVAGCGSSSTAPGVVTAPSGGSTADSATVASASSSTTTSATSTSTTPLPAALKIRPKVAIPSGPPPKTLEVKDLIKGTGPAATANSTITVAYVGELYKNGKVFDASWDHPGAAPLTDPLANLIPGWQQGIPGMRVGGRRELIIPPKLGYGATAQAKIPANSTLVFVIDLRSIS